jgi:hypothetical protein
LPTFEVQEGVRYLRLDYTGFAPVELSEAFLVAGEVIRAEVPGSLRILTILDSRFDETSIEALKRYVAANRPFVLRSAVVASGFWSVVMTSIKLHGRQDLRIFDDKFAALDWLTAL